VWLPRVDTSSNGLYHPDSALIQRIMSFEQLGRTHMILGNRRLPVTRMLHVRKGAIVSVACLVLMAIGCETTRSSTPTTFTTNPTMAGGSLPTLETTQNPVPINSAIHVHGPNNTYAFGQQFRPTNVIDPKERIDQNTVSTTTTTTTSSTFPQIKP